MTAPRSELVEALRDIDAMLPPRMPPTHPASMVSRIRARIDAALSALPASPASAARDKAERECDSLSVKHLAALYRLACDVEMGSNGPSIANQMREATASIQTLLAAREAKS